MSDSLDRVAVGHVAHLARLKITESEAALYATQLSKVLGYVRQLNELDTTEVMATAHPLPLANVLRDDLIRPSMPTKDALANAPDSDGVFFRVPKVLDQESA